MNTVDPNAADAANASDRVVPPPAPPLALTLSCQRVDIRPVQAGDIGDLLEVNRDPEVTKFLPYETWKGLDDGHAWLERVQAIASTGTGQQLVLVSKATARAIGSLLLFRYDAGSARAELGYVLKRSCWGQGLMVEALGGVISHCFDSLALQRLEAEANPDNLASNATLRRLGFSCEGRLRQRWVAKGRRYDTHFYGLLRDEWRAARP
jgi:ribosomal-protein-alanine N-acetyltransferase